MKRIPCLVSLQRQWSTFISCLHCSKDLLNISFIPHFSPLQTTTGIPILQEKKLSTERLGHFPKDTQPTSDKASTLAIALTGITTQERQTYRHMSINKCDKRQDVQVLGEHKFCWGDKSEKNSGEVRFKWGFEGWVGVLPEPRRSKAHQARADVSKGVGPPSTWQVWGLASRKMAVI